MKCVNTGLVFAIFLSLVFGANHARAARVDIEAERFAESNVPAKGLDEATSDKLSGGHAFNVSSDEPIRLSYRFEAPVASDYTLRVREFYPNGRSTLRWRVDGGDWTTQKQQWGLMMSAQADAFVYSDWGTVQIQAGSHVLEIETIDPVMRRKLVKDEDQWYSSAATMEATEHRLHIDYFILTTEPLISVEEVARLYKRTGRYRAYTPKGASDWYEIPWEIDDGAGSILDLVHPTPKPVGNGPESVIRRSGDRFAYADGRPFVMWGNSAPTAPPKHDAEYYARRARRLGLTCVRLHSLDGGLCNVNSGKSYVLDQQRLDQWEYFIHCLKREGIYVIIDPLYSWQAPMLGKADGLPADCMVKGRVKTQFYFDPYLQEQNRRFIKQILTHRNPYTGLVNGEDPTIALFHIINENTIFWAPGLEGTCDHWQKMLRAQFNTWLLKKYGTREKLAATWGEALAADEDPAQGTVQRMHIYELANARNQQAMHRRANDQARYFYDLQVGFYNSVKDYVTEELGFDHILFNGSGWWGVGWLDTLDMAANLPGMDFFDQHGYGNVLRGVLRPDTDTHDKGWQYSLVERFASKAVAGYPFTVSEWNNSNKIGGPMIMAAYGALNGWDGLFQYHTMSSFDGYRDNRRTQAAQLYLQYPTASLAFTRRFIREADLAWRYVTPSDRLFDCTRTEYPKNKPQCDVHSLIGRCEWVFGEGEPFQVDTSQYVRADGACIDSMTGELTWTRKNGLLHIKAPKLQGVVGFTDGEAVDLGDVRMTLDPTGEISVTVAALDEKPLCESRCMFLCAVGEVKGADEPDSPEDRSKQKNKTTALPLVMKPPVGEIVFANPVKAVYALDLSGQRETKLELDNGTTVRIDNSHRTPWFEVVR